MSTKIPHLRIIQINDDIVIADRKAETSAIKNWYENKVGDVFRTRAVAFTDRLPFSSSDYASTIEALDFEQDDLPIIL